jgi:hypothetical protein
VKKVMSNTIFKSLLACTIAVLLLLFNNCKGKTEDAMVLESTQSAADEVFSATGLTGTLCEQDLKNLYSRGWQKFLNTNCTTCHSNGPGKGRFANSNVNAAFADFMQVGYIKVSSNAINPSHNPPYSGTQHVQQVNELKLEWLKGLQDNAICTGDTSSLPQETQMEKITLKTTQQALGLLKDGAKKVVTWTLNSDLSRIKGDEVLPNIPGGKISMTVTRLTNAGGFTYYTFSAPTFYGSAVDARIQGIFVNINGFSLNYPTTFSFIDKSIRKGSGNDLSGLISTGTLVAPKVISEGDTISLSFINITAIDMPPPPAPITVNIAGAKTTVVKPGTGFIDLILSLSSPAVEPIIVSLSEDTTLCGTQATLTNSNSLFKTASTACLPDIYEAVCTLGGNCSTSALEFGRAKSVVGATYRRFDWDYNFPVNSVTFGANEQHASIRIYFSKDVRHEKNRLLTLEIADVLGSVIVGANKTVHYVINKYTNPLPDQKSLTFSELMNPTGILGQHCLKCHNSTDLAGGYDMTDYEMMIARRVVIPFDVNSKMYFRMHPTPEFLAKPMPQDGFRNQLEIHDVADWILQGAKND